MTEFLQYKSNRLGEEFVDYESWVRYYGKRYHSKCKCGKPVTILSISFGAGFCTPACYIKLSKEYLEWCKKEWGMKE